MADANFFDQFDAPASGVGQDRPQPTMGRPADPNYFDSFDKPSPEIDWKDILHSALSGAIQGGYGVAAMPGDLNEMARNAGHFIAEKATGKQLPMPARLGQGIVPTSQELMDRTGYDPYKPKTALGGYAESAAGMVPGALAFGGARSAAEAAGNAVRLGVVPGVASEAAGNIPLVKGTKAEPWARLAGAIVGGVAPSRAITPFPSSPERQAAVRTLRDEGVTDLTAGQVTGSKPLRYLESETGGGRVGDMMDRQGEQFTSAALRRIGVDGDRATPEVIDHAFHDIGNEFGRLTAGNVLNVDPQFIGDVRQSLQNYNRRVAQPNRAPLIRDYAQEIANVANGGPVGGEVYQSLRSRIGADAQASSDPYTANALRDMQHALDDAMERSIAASNPADLGAFQNVRRLYRNLMVMVPATTGAGEEAALGLVSPAKLRQAAVGQGRRAYARGQGDFADLAHAGQGVMTPLPQSGTAPRAAARLIPMALGNVAGSAITGEPMMGGIAGALAGLAAPALVGRAVLSGPGRAYLGNQIIPRSNTSGAGRLGLAETYATQPDRKADSVLAKRALERALVGH